MSIIKRKESEFLRRDSFSVYSGLKGTFMQAYRPAVSLDEKAQSIAQSIHGAKMVNGAQCAQIRETLIKQ
jgi:hypothetical protein